MLFYDSLDESASSCFCSSSRAYNYIFGISVQIASVHESVLVLLFFLLLFLHLLLPILLILLFLPHLPLLLLLLLLLGRIIIYWSSCSDPLCIRICPSPPPLLSPPLPLTPPLSPPSPLARSAPTPYLPSS